MQNDEKKIKEKSNSSVEKNDKIKSSSKTSSNTLKKKSKEEKREENLKELKQTKNKTFATAAKHALDGIIRAFKTERNLRIDYVIGLFVLIGSLFFDFTKTEFACLCLTIGFVIFAEMINSTVEYIVDLITDKYDDRAKAAKDIAAGGVLIASIVAVIVAYFLFADKLYNATTAVLNSILSSKLYILLVIVFGVVLLAVILKGFFGKGANYSQSHPSVRVALAFALTTFVYIVTKDIFVGAIAFILSIMIAQIRIENTKIRPIYIILSALLGILVVLIIYQVILMKPEISNFLHGLLNVIKK